MLKAEMKKEIARLKKENQQLEKKNSMYKGDTKTIVSMYQDDKTDNDTILQAIMRGLLLE